MPVEVEVVASLDVHRVASGGPITDGHWPLQARLHVAGFDRTTSVRVSPAHDAAGAAGVRVVGQEPLVVALARDVPDVVVQAARGPAALAARLAGEGFRFGPTDGRSLEVVLMGSGTRGTADIPAVLVISDSEAPYRLTVRLRPGRTGLRLRTRVRLPVGSDRAATIKVEFGARAEASVDLGAARVTADGLVFPEEAPRVGRMGLVLHHAREAVMDTASTLRSRGGRIALRARRRGGRLVRRARRP